MQRDDIMDRASPAQPVSAVDANPVLVEMARGGIVESQHRGVVVEMSADGELRFAVGHHQRKIYPRSLIKPLHATALFTSGAAVAFGLGKDDIALAASSHLARPEQLALLHKWMDRVGLFRSQLKCGTHRPFDSGVADALVASGDRPTEIHNNNSGRHLAILTIAKHRGYTLDSYWKFQHPAQAIIRAAVRNHLDWKYAEQSSVVDECGLPTEAIPIDRLGSALASMCEHGRSGQGGAGRAVLDAMSARPDLVTGTGKISTMLCQATDGRVIVKGGSEGGFAVIIPHSQIALVLKIDDGAHRAAEIVLLEILWRRGFINRTIYGAIREKFDGRLKNYLGEPTSELRVAF